jgi:hypothetical protein
LVLTDGEEVVRGLPALSAAGGSVGRFTVIPVSTIESTDQQACFQLRGVHQAILWRDDGNICKAISGEISTTMVTVVL